MAAVGVTISGYLADKYGRWVRPVTLVGEASLTDVGIGGGPIIPPGNGGPPSDAHPAHPIVLPGDPSWGDPHPAHPIVIPPDRPPGFPLPPPDGGVKPPPPNGGWGYHPDYGWGFFPMGQSAGPKA